MRRIIPILFVMIICLSACGPDAAGETYTCTFSISCTELIDCDALVREKRELVPEDGIILSAREVTFTEGDSVFDVLMKLCRESKLHLEYSEAPMFNTAYVEGMNNLYEFDAGALSGWEYTVNGTDPNIGSSAYILSDGDVVEWYYTLGQ